MAVEKAIASSSLVEVIDRILDKGIVIDAWARVSLVGIELLAVEARVVIAGVDTFLKYAEAIGLTPLAAPPPPAPLVRPPQPAVAVKPEKPDDLTRIRGVGAGIQYRLNRGGVWTFAQLARMTPEDIYEFTGVSVEAVIRRRVIEQARELAAEAGSSD